MIEKSSKLDNVRYEIRGPVLDEANRMIADGAKVLKLNIGNPAPFGFTTPEEIIRDMQMNLHDCEGYSDSKGIFSARKAIMQYCQLKKIPNVDVNDIYTGNGCSEMITLSLQAMLNHGDEILVPAPDYPLWTASVSLAGGTPVLIETKAEDEFKLTPEALRAAITPRTKLLILPYPNNPTGAIMDRDELQAIANVIRETNIMVLSDEIYNSLTYGPEIDGMKERTIVVDGFSKSYAMTGWRLGWAMGPKELMRHICKIHQFGIMSAPTTAQFAGIEAIRTGDDDIARMRDQYDLRRRYLLGELRSMGLECFEPEGAFYIFPSIESTGLSSEEFCERLLHEQEVAVIPGSAFGASGEGHIRISYSYSMSHLREACSRMKIFLENLKQEQK